MSSGLVCAAESVGGVVPVAFVILRSIDSSVAGVIAAGFSAAAGVPVCVVTVGNMLLNFSMAHWCAEIFTVVMNGVTDTCGFGSGIFHWTRQALRKFLQWTIIGSSWSSMLKIRLYITSASRSELKPSYTRNDGIGTHCIMSSVLSSVIFPVLNQSIPVCWVGFQVFLCCCISWTFQFFDFSE